MYMCKMYTQLWKWYCSNNITPDFHLWPCYLMFINDNFMNTNREGMLCLGACGKEHRQFLCHLRNALSCSSMEMIKAIIKQCISYNRPVPHNISQWVNILARCMYIVMVMYWPNTQTYVLCTLVSKHRRSNLSSLHCNTD